MILIYVNHTKSMGLSPIFSFEHFYKNIYKNVTIVIVLFSPLKNTMSAANAAAKKRRANMNIMPPQTQTNPSQNPSQSDSSSTNVPISSMSEKGKGLTLSQVIQLIDSRLLKLEDESSKQIKLTTTSTTDTVSEEALKPILQEYDHRFSMLATQITDLKEIVMKLQSYTMDVNKTLLEERIQFMSETTTEVLQDTQTGSDEVLKLDDLKLEEAEIVSSESMKSISPPEPIAQHEPVVDQSDIDNTVSEEPVTESITKASEETEPITIQISSS